MKTKRKSTNCPEFKFIETEEDLRDKNSALELEKSALKLENSNLETKNSDLKTENSDLKTENSDLKTQNSDLETKNSDLETKNSNLRTKNSDLKTENSDLKSKNSDLLRQLEEQKALSNMPKLTMQDVLNWGTMQDYVLTLANHHDVQVIANLLYKIVARFHFWDPELAQCIEVIEQYERDLQRNVYTQTNHIAGDYVEHQTNQSKTKRK